MPAGPQHALRGARVRDRGEVRGDARAAEDVGDQDVGAVVGRRLQPLPGVRAVHGDAASRRQRQLLGDQFEQSVVRLHDVLAGAGAGGGEVAGQRQGAAAEVDDVERIARCGHGVQDVGEPLGVLELQVRGRVQIDVRLRRSVDGEQPGPRPVDVGHELGGAVVHLPGHGQGLPRAGPLFTGHLFAAPCRAGPGRTEFLHAAPVLELVLVHVVHCARPPREAGASRGGRDGM